MFLMFSIACTQSIKEDPITDTEDTQDSDCALGVFYSDVDGDGFGDAMNWVSACEQPDGTVLDASDCDDTDPFVNSESVETCNQKDDNCNGQIDDGVGEVWYADRDDDGYGDMNSSQQACENPEGYVSNDEDCEDNDDSIYPGATEVCDEVDNNCDGVVDEGLLVTYYADNDYDSFGDPNNTVESCSAIDGMVAIGGDCDDGSAGVYPGAVDGCNTIDDDCDGDVDEDVKLGWSLMTIDTQTMQVYEINTSNASVTSVVNVQSGFTGINSMDVWEDGTSIVHSNAGSVLSSFDVCQGTGSELGETGVVAMGGISFGSGNLLYGLDSGNNTVMQLNINGGPSSVVGSLGTSIGNNGMAYDCSTDTLYGADAQQNRIFTVDPNTGVASNFKSTTVPFASVGLEFDHSTGMLFAATGSQLWTIDPSTGASSLIGSFGGVLVDDLAFYPTCP